MTNFEAVDSTDKVRADKYSPLPGLTSGLNFPASQTFPQGEYRGVGALSITGDAVDDLTFVDGGSSPPAVTTFKAVQDDDAGISGAWFDRVHVLPRAKIDFGNIIGITDKTFELYNAFRRIPVSLVGITNNALPGVIFPDITPTVVMPAQTSILDPSSTDNTGGVGLGTLVKAKIRALADGLPTFDTNIIFDTDKGDPELLVTGTRVVLMPQEYEVNVRETLAFLTDIIGALDGQEQRIALRKQPRQIFEVEYALTDNDRQRMQAQLMDWMDNIFGFPLWHEKLTLTSAVSAGATQYAVLGADDVDFRVGGLGLAFTDANTFDVLNITAVTDTLITVADASVNAYPVGTRIVPIRTARILKSVPARRRVTNLEVFKITFEVTDNDTGAIAGSTTPGFWSLHNSRVLFDDCNVTSGQLDQTYARRIYRIDNQTGKVTQTSSWDRYKRTHAKGFIAHNRAEIIELRKVLLALRGRQKSFYIPTFIEDLEVKAQLTISTNTMDIERIDYERFITTRIPKKRFRISFSNGDPDLVRIVQSVASVDATTERLTLDTTWPSTVQVADVKRVQFYELVRFASDSFVLTYPRLGLATVKTQVVAVFDDNS